MGPDSSWFEKLGMTKLPIGADISLALGQHPEIDVIYINIHI